MACIIGRSGRVGVDIECVRASLITQDLIEATLTDREQAALRSFAEPSRAFFHLWTRKEALLKGLAVGLAFPPRLIEVVPNGSFSLRDKHEPVTGWSVRSFEPLPEYVVAIAVQIPN